MEHFKVAEELVNRCQATTAEGLPCQASKLSDDIFCVFHSQKDEHVEKREEIRASQPLIGGRKRKYIKGTKVDISALSDVLEGLGEVIGNLREMDQTVSTCNSLIRAWQVAANCFLDQQEREQILLEIAELQRELGLE